MDLIDRQAAIDAIFEAFSTGDEDADRYIAEKILADVPSAELNVRVLSKDADCISRKAVLNLAKDVTLKNGAKHRCVDATMIDDLPSAQPEESMNCAFCKLSRCESDKECHWKVRWNDADANT